MRTGTKLGLASVVLAAGLIGSATHNYKVSEGYNTENVQRYEQLREECKVRHVSELSVREFKEILRNPDMKSPEVHKKEEELRSLVKNTQVMKDYSYYISHENNWVYSVLGLFPIVCLWTVYGFHKLSEFAGKH
jgi:hypothetical protein